MLLPVIRSFIQKHHLLEQHQALTIGVSGGPDSLALLHLIVRLREEFDLQLRVAHLNHQLRSEADADSDFVSSVAAAWNVPCIVERVDIESLASQYKLSIEEAGRRARYEFFARLGNTIAVAHNADDQTETVLMHFLRGAGVGGLRGMLPKTINGWSLNNKQWIVRPLLNVTRQEIETYCAQHNLQPRLDLTNSDTKYFRNRLRHELIPTLETYNPNIRAVLRRAAEVSSGDYELLQTIIANAWNATLVAPPELDLVAFDLAKWRKHPLALQRALLREAVQYLKSELRDVDFVPIDKAAQWIQSAQSGQTADLLAGLCVRVSGSMLKVGEWKIFLRNFSALNEIALPLNSVTQFGVWQVTATVLEGWSLGEIESNNDRSTAYLDASFAPFILRSRRDGDRFSPLGMEGKTIKLSDFMINQKIPLEDRDRQPLVVGGDTVLWVCGFRTSHQARVSSQTEKVIKLQINR